MSNIEKTRKTILTLIMLMIATLLLFGVVFQNDLKIYEEKLDLLINYDNEKVDSYFTRTFFQINLLLETMENDWEKMFGRNPALFPMFTESVLEFHSRQAGIVFTNQGDFLTIRPEYMELEINLEELVADRSANFLFGEEDEIFGQGERLFVIGREFDGLGGFEVYIGVLEQVLFDRYSSSLDYTIVSALFSRVNKTTLHMYGLMLAIIGMGIVLAYQMRKMNVVDCKDCTSEKGEGRDG